MRRTEIKTCHRRMLLAAAFVLLTAAPMAAARAEEMGPIKAFINNNYLETLGILPALLWLALLALIVHIDRYIRPDLKRTMRMIIVAVFTLVLQNYVDYRLTIGEPHQFIRTLASIYGYAIRPVILLFFLKVIAPQKRFRWGWALLGVNAAVHMTALFSPIVFEIDVNNAYLGGPLSSFCLYVSLILLICLFVMTIRVFKPQKRREAWVPVAVLGLIVGSLVMDSNVGYVAQPISYLTIAVIMSCVAYYIWLHLQFVREHEEALVAGQRVQLTLSQIKPHFLYNTLNAISALCDADSKMAKLAVDQFARYLRGNMSSIDQNGPIPFAQELDHTRTYLDIEQMRFEDALQVEYHITCTDFSIPALTMEPLAENAVRHGVRGNKGGRGIVTIATKDAGDHFEVIITDDGPGFDPSTVPDDGKPHVGIANVRERLADVCGGKLDIQSKPGEGTTATILLPKKQEA